MRPNLQQHLTAAALPVILNLPAPAAAAGERLRSGQVSVLMGDDDLREAVAAFVGAFEEVFDRDWGYAQTMLANIDSFIAPEGTFLNPGVEDEVEDWGARAELLDRYRQLLRVMQQHGIQPKKPW